MKPKEPMKHLNGQPVNITSGVLSADGHSSKGQSLVEFVLVMPILVLLLVGGFSMGLGSYQAHLASDAVQMPAMHKLALSNITGAVDGGALAGYMNGGGIQANLSTGSMIDSASVVNSDAYTSVVVGSKTYQSVASFIPGFTITVGEAMNRNLLEAANAGAQVRPANTPWVPGGAPNPPP